MWFGKPDTRGMHDRKNVKGLAKALLHRDAIIRHDAAECLARLAQADARALDALREALSDTDAEVRGTAAGTLHYLGGNAATELLRQALGDSDDSVRRQAIWSLRCMRGAGVSGLLCEALKHREPSVRRAVAEVLRDGAGHGLVGPLREALQDADDVVRRTAAEALGKTGSVDAVQPLCEALTHDSASLRRAAVEALLNYDDPRAIRPLGDALADGSAAGSAERVIDWMLRVGADSAVEPIVRATESDDDSTVLAAVRALGRLQDVRAAEPLCRALKHRDVQVRNAAVEALLACGGPSSVRPLCDALEDGQTKAPAHLVASIARFGGEHAVEALCRLLRHRDEHIFGEAARTLGGIQDLRAADALAGVLEIESRRVPAALALAQLRDARAFAPLLEALGSESAYTRRDAVIALGRLGDARAAAPLCDLLSDQDASVLEETVIALGQIGDADVIPALCELLACPRTVDSQLCNFAVKTAAREALKLVLERSLKSAQAHYLTMVADMPVSIKAQKWCQMFDPSENYWVSAPIDLSELRQTALQELTSRGLAAG